MNPTKKKLLLPLLLLTILLTSILGTVNTSQARTKSIIVSSIDGNKLSYYNCYWASEYLGTTEWENLIGGGKLKTATLSPKAKYALFNFNTMKNYKTTKADFVTSIPEISTEKENGKVWYWGMAAEISVKNGKVTAIKQVYQS